MLARRIGLVMCLMLVPALIIGGLACGSKESNPVSSTGGGGNTVPSDPAPFSDGAWRLDYTITATTADPGCGRANGSFVDTFTVAGGELGGFIGAHCTFAVNGTHFSQTCRDTFAYLGTCRLVVTISGGGDVNGDTFAAVYTVSVATLGNCSLFHVPRCTFQIAATGSKLSSIARGVLVRSVAEGIERLAVGRALEPVRGGMRPR